MPHPPYEFDIFIVQTRMPEEGNVYTKAVVTSAEITQDLKDLAARIQNSNGFSIIFLNSEDHNYLLHEGGLPHIGIVGADARDSILQDVTGWSHEIKEIHNLLLNYKNKVRQVYNYVVRPYESRDDTLNRE